MTIEGDEVEFVFEPIKFEWEVFLDDLEYLPLFALQGEIIWPEVEGDDEER